MMRSSVTKGFSPICHCHGGGGQDSHGGGGQDSSVGKSLNSQSKDCEFEPHRRRGVFLVWVLSKPLTPNC